MTLRRRATVYVGAHERVPSPGACEAGSREAPKPRLLDRMREALRLRRYSRRTEDAYIVWARRYVLFHGKRHPAALGAPEVTGFLTSRAVEGRVAASSQNQALSALLFLYHDVLEIDLPCLDGIVRARRPQRLPVVLRVHRDSRGKVGGARRPHHWLPARGTNRLPGGRGVPTMPVLGQSGPLVRRVAPVRGFPPSEVDRLTADWSGRASPAAQPNH